MTKTLTEQWREGTLKGGYYYIKMKDGEIYIDHTEYQVGEKAYQWEYSDINEVKEVLEPVPSYEEYKRLQEQINNANMVINKCLTLTNDYDKKCFLEGYKIMWGVK